MKPGVNLNLELADDIRSFFDDPLGFVIFAYPWDEPGGSLEKLTGPDTWQKEFLVDLGHEVRQRNFDLIHPVEPIRMATSSGHGIGKSTLVAWLVNWIMSTRPDARGTITANTFTQLETKTWSQIQRWTRLSIASHWFEITGNSMYHRDHPETWFCSAQTCRRENSEAFAGQHAAGSTSFYIFDESSAVPDKIFEVAEGGLTDGEPMIFLFGNPTRTAGKLYRTAFGSERHLWNHRSIDSRTAKMTNKVLIEDWIAEWGEDSDFVRIRVRGLPPKASDLQYIDNERVFQAQQRTPSHFDDDPLIVGLDVARGGNAYTVFRFRRGLDAVSIPPVRITGEQSRDSMRMVSIASQILSTEYDGILPTAMFIDSGFGGPIVDRLKQLNYVNVHEVMFGGHPADPQHFANMRSFMWGKMRDWLLRGSIDNSTELETDLTGPGYHLDQQDRLVLEVQRRYAKARPCQSRRWRRPGPHLRPAGPTAPARGRGRV